MTNEERDQLDREMAEVMGWDFYTTDASERIKSYPCIRQDRDKRLWLVPESEAPWQLWQPSRLIQQAMMVLEVKFDSWSIERWPHPEMGADYTRKCQVWVEGLCYWGDGNTTQEAVCLAVQAAWKGSDKDEK